MRTTRVTTTLALSTILISCATSPSATTSPPAAHPKNPPLSSAPSVRDSAVLSAEPWTYESARGQIVRTKNYRLFMTETDALLAGRLPGFLEDALAHYRTAITPLPAPDLRLDSYLMDNRPQWARLTQRLLGDRATPFLRIQRGGFATRGIGVYYDIGTFDTLAIAAHEGWHQYTQRVFRNRLPTWLEEGIASYMEGHRWKGTTPIFLPWANLERFDQLRAMHSAGRAVPLHDFVASTGALGQSEESGLDFYAQGWALAHFLQTERRAGLKRVLTDAADGRLTRTVRQHAQRDGATIRSTADMNRALFSAYFGDLDVAQREFTAYLETITRPGARDAAVAGRSPLDE